MDKHLLKENITHGTVSFPLALYEWDETWSGCVPPHWHNEMELIYFKKGKFNVWHNAKEYTVEAPAIMCIHPEELHSLLLKKHCRESAIVFNINILSFEHYDAIQAKLINPLMDGRLKMPMRINGEDKIFYQIAQCYEKIEQKIKKMNQHVDESVKNAAYLEVKSILFEMLAILYENNCLSYTKAINNRDDYHIGNLKKVIGYINEHYASVIRLGELAELVNMNSQYFCRYFKENIGKTATEYINEIRIEKAAEALVETDEKVINIAQDVGFENTGYFIRRFKMQKGVTPSKYRTNNKRSK